MVNVTIVAVISHGVVPRQLYARREKVMVEGQSYVQKNGTSFLLIFILYSWKNWQELRNGLNQNEC